jgi:hypothetical protein
MALVLPPALSLVLALVLPLALPLAIALTLALPLAPPMDMPPGLGLAASLAPPVHLSLPLPLPSPLGPLINLVNNRRGSFAGVEASAASEHSNRGLLMYSGGKIRCTAMGIRSGSQAVVSGLFGSFHHVTPPRHSATRLLGKTAPMMGSRQSPLTT